MNYPLKTPYDHLCFQVYINSLLINRVYTPFLKPLGITYLQYIVLILLWNKKANKIKDITIKNICNELHIDSGTISPVVKSLIKKNLIEKKTNEKDERQVLINLTENGIKLESKVPKLQKNVIDELSLACSDPHTLISLLQDFSNKLSSKK